MDSTLITDFRICKLFLLFLTREHTNMSRQGAVVIYERSLVMNHKSDQQKLQTFRFHFQDENVFLVDNPIYRSFGI